ncbi:MAG TPA: hypothetical protein VMD25_10195 [Acidobacteriaceae bacterium]|nr:hypothetical protein [Acidobacteriaceae bacterium]
MEPIVQRVQRHPHQRGEGPNFLAVVAMSGVVLVVFFILAFLVLHSSARELLPGVHQTAHPYSMLRVGRPTRAA